MSTPTLAIHQPEAADARSLSDQAYYRIRELIVTLELAPGSLVERTRADGAPGRRANTGARGAASACSRAARRGVSAPRDVRLARRRSRPRGTLRSTQHARAPGVLASRRSERPTTTGLASTLLLDELDSVGEEPSERLLIDLDQRIHRHVYDCTHNPFLATTLNEYYVLTLRIWFLALDRVARLGDAVREHRALLEAIRDGDADGAEDAMRRHVRGLRGRSPPRPLTGLYIPASNSYISRSRLNEHSPASREGSRHRLRHRRQLGRLPPHRPGLVGRRPARQRTAPEPGRVDGTRIELHLPGRPLEGDDAAHARERAPVRGDGRVHGVGRNRGRAHRGTHAGADPAHRLGEGVGR